MKYLFYFITVLLAIANKTVIAQQINYDPSFGENGIATFSASGAHLKLLKQQDDKIVALGIRNKNTPTSYSFDIIINRFLPNGTIDSTYGNNGTVLLTYDDVDLEPRDMALTPNNQLLVAYNLYTSITDYYPFVCRINADGTVDSSFADNGHLSLFANNVNDYNRKEVQSIVMAKDGKFIVGANGRESYQSQRPKIILNKYNADGTYALEFGNNGSALLAIVADTASYITGMKMQDDEKILITGTIHNITTDAGISKGEAAVLRYLANGTPDPSFGNQGVSVIRFMSESSRNYENLVAIQSDNKILVTSMNRHKLVLFRLLENGQQDPNFALGNVYKDTNCTAPTLALMNVYNTNILTLHNSENGQYIKSSVRHTEDGSLKTNYGIQGYKNIQFQSYSKGYGSVSLQYDNNSIVISGSVKSSSGSSTAALLKYTIDTTGITNINTVDNDVSHISIYPNPAHNEVNITWNAAIKVQTLNLVNMMGQVVHTTAVAAQQQSANMLTNSFPAGVYTLQLHTDKGMAARKLVIQ
jgi:uncharacterized delta-60 repeat protein